MTTGDTGPAATASGAARAPAAAPATTDAGAGPAALAFDPPTAAAATAPLLAPGDGDAGDGPSDNDDDPLEPSVPPRRGPGRPKGASTLHRRSPYTYLPCTDVHLPHSFYYIHARLILAGSRNNNPRADGTPKKRRRSKVGLLPDIARRIIVTRPGRSSFSS